MNTNYYVHRFRMAIFARLELRDAATLTGALYGKKVEVKPGASLIGRPALGLFVRLFVHPWDLPGANP